MQAYLADLGRSAAAEAERRVPHVEGERIVVSSGVELGPRGWRAVVHATSSIWHLPEFGGGRFPPRPYLRPGVQALLSRVGGRWRSS